MKRVSITEENLSALQTTNRLLVLEAVKRGYSVGYVASTPSEGSGIVFCTKDNQEFCFKSLNTTLTPSYGVFACEDKYLSYCLLKDAGVPTPETIVVSPNDSTDSAINFLQDKKRVVVKPVAGTHGDGVITDVGDNDTLDSAIETARQAISMQPDVLVQEQVGGLEYRFLVLNGDVIAVAHREPAFVVGDGVKSILELIEEKNADPRRGDGHSSMFVTIDKNEVISINSERFLEDIPNIGEIKHVLKVSNLSKGGESTNCTDVASESLKQMAIKSAQVCHTNIAGVDIMTSDISNGDSTNSHVIEINCSPGIRMHQFVSNGEPIDVASMLFSAIESNSLAGQARD